MLLLQVFTVFVGFDSYFNTTPPNHGKISKSVDIGIFSYAFRVAVRSPVSFSAWFVHFTTIFAKPPLIFATTLAQLISISYLRGVRG